MTKWYIKIVNNRNVKTLCGGLPSFGEWETFASLEEAAEEIYNRAYDLIDADTVESIESDPDDEDAFSAEHERRMEEVKDEIVSRGSWHYDGVSYYIESAEYGELFTGTPSSYGGLENIEPLLNGFEEERNLYRKEDALEVLTDFIRENADSDLDYAIDEEPYGWSVEYKDEDGNEHTDHFCWRAR